MADKPYYPFKSIGSISSLARTLGVNPRILIDISEKADDSYTEIQIKDKSDKYRIVYDPKHELKIIQKRINSRIFEKVEYPRYLQGSLKDEIQKRDYVENARLHSGAKTITRLDIKRFFDSIRPSYVKDIFLYLFKFPEDVSEVLTKLLTFRGKVPQGACTSSYLANLIFFNSEYSLVSRFRSKGYVYSRLLDDITISSKSSLNEEEISNIISSTVGMFKKYGLKSNNKKKAIEHYEPLKNNPLSFKITGVWASHSGPKIRKKDRRYVRQMVFECEKLYKICSHSEEYHKIWNKTSGLVAQLKRMDHKQSASLRNRLSSILPIYDDNQKNNLLMQVAKCLKTNDRARNKYGLSVKLGRIHHQINILSRTEKLLAKSLRRQLNKRFPNIPSKKEYWHE